MITLLSSLWIGTYYAVYYACYLTALVSVLVAVRVWRHRIPSRLRLTALAIVGVLFLRLLLFDNPQALFLYKWLLRPESIGMRQGGVLYLDIRKYRRNLHQPKLANVAVGSSQVGAIFNYWDGTGGQPLEVYSLAGMKALDFVLHADAIAAYNPERVIVYLSAFDMTGTPELFSLPLAPPRPLAMWSVLKRLRRSGLTWAETSSSVHEFIASQLLPEYRYRYVFRAFLKQWFGEAYQSARPPAANQRFAEFSTYYDPQWLDYNFGFFAEFLGFCRSRGIEVMVVEGQVNPTAVTPTIADLNRTARRRLEDLRAEFPNLRYVPASDVYEFSAAEYHDTTHVLPEAARIYTERLSAYLAR